MMLKLIILKSHPKVFLLGDVVELDEEPSYLLQNCHEVTGHGLSKYPPYSDQDDLSNAKIFYSTINSQDDETSVKKALDKSKGF